MKLFEFRNSRILAERNTLNTWRDTLQLFYSKIKGWAYWFSSVVCFATTIAQPLLSPVNSIIHT